MNICNKPDIINNINREKFINKFTNLNKIFLHYKTQYKKNFIPSKKIWSLEQEKKNITKLLNEEYINTNKIESELQSYSENIASLSDDNNYL